MIATWLQDRRVMLAFAGMLLAAVVISVSRGPGGIGGTGITDQPGGIGGTGIFGRIDEFGSIWVNGLEIHYDSNQVVTRRDRTETAEVLEIGQVVSVVAKDIEGSLQASSITLVEEVLGPVTQAASNELLVMGQRVLISEMTIFERGGLNNLPNPGELVSVSGFRTIDGDILASRVDTTPGETLMRVQGTVVSPDGSGFTIGELPVLFPDQGFESGVSVEAIGTLRGSKLHARRVSERGPFRFSAPVAEISVQRIDTSTGPSAEDGWRLVIASGPMNPEQQDLQVKPWQVILPAAIEAKEDKAEPEISTDTLAEPDTETRPESATEESSDRQQDPGTRDVRDTTDDTTSEPEDSGESREGVTDSRDTDRAPESVVEPQRDLAPTQDRPTRLERTDRPVTVDRPVVDRPILDRPERPQRD